MLKRFLGFLNFCFAATLSFYYLQLCGLPVKEFFAVAPQVFVLALCFILLFAGESFMRAFVIPVLLYYGVTGIFFYPWSGVDMANQAVHVLLLMNALYFLMALALGFKIISLFFGLLTGIAVCAGLRFYQNAFLQREPQLAKKYLPEDMRPQKKKKKKTRKNLKKMMSIDESWQLSD
ncbi:MAG: hypothetical protein U9O97_02200 [Elusimicrobiota bacterium]|nr:hypothetical protein [Elusimicrobiota bacterium]